MGGSSVSPLEEPVAVLELEAPSLSLPLLDAEELEPSSVAPTVGLDVETVLVPVSVSVPVLDIELLPHVPDTPADVLEVTPHVPPSVARYHGSASVQATSTSALIIAPIDPRAAPGLDGRDSPPAWMPLRALRSTGSSMRTAKAIYHRAPPG